MANDDLIRHARIMRHYLCNELPNGVGNTIDALCDSLEALEEQVEAMREGLNLFVKSAYPVATEINPRGHNWCEAYLDSAIQKARPLINKEPKE